MTVYGEVQQDREKALEAAAGRLDDAYRTRTPCAPVRDLIGTEDVASAYALQQRFVENRERSGARVVGRKIGLTSPAVQRQLGVDRPDFGVLFDDMDMTGESAVPSDRLLQPKVEAEVAFILGEDLNGELDAGTVRAAVAHAAAAIEIVDSRIRNWDISITDTVADNASSGLFVLGEDRVSLDHVEPIDVAMTMHIDGVEVSHGSGADCLGDPLIALQWLARTARDFGRPLRAGQIILSGALGPMAPVRAGSRVLARVSGIGSVEFEFDAADR